MGDISREISNLFAQATGAIDNVFAGSGIKRGPMALTQGERALCAAQQAKDCFAKIATLQAKCNHTWRFNRQASTGDGERWDVAYKCAECNLERRERKRPVCDTCDTTLRLASISNHETEFLRLQAQSGVCKTPIIFECPQCRSLHALYYETD